MRTLVELQSSVLNWSGDAGDTGLLATVAKDAINQAQREFLSEQQYDFMLYPKIETISVTSGQRYYGLNPLFGTMLWAYNPTTDEYMEEVPATGAVELGENQYDATQDSWNQIQLTSMMPVLRQPSSPTSINLKTSTASTETSDFVVKGIDSYGQYVTETITSTISSTVNTLCTTIFAVITDFFRTSAGSANVIMTDDSTSDVLCTLLSGDERARRFVRAAISRAHD